jgi:type III pantothenate kinase
MGGTIAPGLDMRFKALHSYTDKLPLVQKEGETPVLALNSEMAIRAGVVNGIVYEVEGYVNKLKETYPELLIFLTGGNCFFFESKLKKPIFANQNLVLIGLNSIIKYNAENKKN